MSSNYMFALRRQPQAAQTQAAQTQAAQTQAAQPQAAQPQAAQPRTAQPVQRSSGGRFSLNRLISLKSTGGCRSCS